MTPPAPMCQSASVELDVSTSDQDGRTVVAAKGEVDLFTAPSLDTELTRVVSDGATSVVVDLGGVEFLDSTGLSVIVKALKRVREAGGTLSVVVTSERVGKVFRITGLDQIVPVHASLAEALEA
jgi:anti-sigma B factor antagonist